MRVITSKSNSLVKNTKKLHHKKHRKHSYLIEGWNLFEEAIVNNRESILLIFTLERYAARLTDFSCVQLVSESVLYELSDSRTPQGILAEIAFTKPPCPRRLKGRYLMLEDVQDPGNVGTMVRTADAAGFDGVILSHHSADIYNGKTLRSMQGSHFHLPIYRMKVGEFLKICDQSTLPILVSTVSKDSLDYRALKLMTDFVLVMGNESQGVSPGIISKASQLIHIRLQGKAESLNVAVAAGILMFHLNLMF